MSSATADLLERGRRIAAADHGRQTSVVGRLLLEWLRVPAPIYAGANIHHNTWDNLGAGTDENAVTFRGSQQGDFVKMKQLIEERMKAARAQKNGPASAADEIAKLAALRDQGILTPEEFDAKKKQLLGL